MEESSPRHHAVAATTEERAEEADGNTDASDGAAHEGGVVSGTTIAAAGLSVVAAVTFAPESTAAAFNWLGRAVTAVVDRLAPVVGPTLADHAKDTVEASVASVVGKGRISDAAAHAAHMRVLHATGCAEEANKERHGKRRPPDDDREQHQPSPQRLRLT